MSTWNDIITDALIEINAYSIADPPPIEDMQFAIRKLTRIIDDWAARRIYAYSTTFQVFTLAANHAPHLIGPGLIAPDFAIAVRPVRIESAALILTDATPNTDQPITLRNAQWWAAQRTKTITSNVPTDLYYEPDWPNGALNFWPVPSYAYQARLEMWTALGGIPLDGNGHPDPTQTVSAPQGYEKAAVLTLAEESCDFYGRPMPQSLPGRAARARATILGNNAKSPEIGSADYGTRGRRSGGFNWTTGMPS